MGERLQSARSVIPSRLCSGKRETGNETGNGKRETGLGDWGLGREALRAEEVSSHREAWVAESQSPESLLLVPSPPSPCYFSPEQPGTLARFR